MVDKKVMSKEDFEDLTSLVGKHGLLCDLAGGPCTGDCQDHAETHFKQYIKVEGE